MKQIHYYTTYVTGKDAVGFESHCRLTGIPIEEGDYVCNLSVKDGEGRIKTETQLVFFQKLQRDIDEYDEDLSFMRRLFLTGFNVKLRLWGLDKTDEIHMCLEHAYKYMESICKARINE